MTKTPDETKKGLVAPVPVHFHRGDPEPHLTPLALRDLEVLHTNALALIQQLEADVESLRKFGENLSARNEELHGKLIDLEAERDALMHWAKGRCDTCAHKDDCVKHDPDPEGYVMLWYDDCEIWEWRGVQKEETT